MGSHQVIKTLVVSDELQLSRNVQKSQECLDWPFSLVKTSIVIWSSFSFFSAHWCGFVLRCFTLWSEYIYNSKHGKCQYSSIPYNNQWRKSKNVRKAICEGDVRQEHTKDKDRPKGGNRKGTSSQKLGRCAIHWLRSVWKSLGQVRFGSKMFRLKIFAYLHSCILSY